MEPLILLHTGQALTFDGHPVIPVPVPSHGRNEMFQSSDDVINFLASSMKDMVTTRTAFNSFTFFQNMLTGEKTNLPLQNVNFIMMKYVNIASVTLTLVKGLLNI